MYLPGRRVNSLLPSVNILYFLSRAEKALKLELFLTEYGELLMFL